jgi:hypothetical protein
MHVVSGTWIKHPTSGEASNKYEFLVRQYIVALTEIAKNLQGAGLAVFRIKFKRCND